MDYRSQPLREAVEETLLRQKWVFAKTMPQNPHEWAAGKTWTGPVPYFDVCAYIRDNGYGLEFGRTVYPTIDVGPHRYWIFPGTFEWQRVMNRALNPPPANARVIR